MSAYHSVSLSPCACLSLCLHLCTCVSACLYVSVYLSLPVCLSRSFISQEFLGWMLLHKQRGENTAAKRIAWCLVWEGIAVKQQEVNIVILTLLEALIKPICAR